MRRTDLNPKNPWEGETMMHMTKEGVDFIFHNSHSNHLVFLMLAFFKEAFVFQELRKLLTLLFF